MQSWKRWFIWIVAIIAILLILPLLIPMSAYKKQAEGIATNALKSPVKIGTLQIAFLPSPRLNANNVAIGANNELTLAKLSVVPNLTTLFSDAMVISSVQIESPTIKKAAMDIIGNISKQPKDSTSKSFVTVRQINVENAKLIWPGLHLPEINADVILSAENLPKAAIIEDIDRKLKLDLISEGNQQLITLTGKAWTVPVGPPLLIDALSIDMVLFDNKLDISKIDVALYGGELSGSANLSWDKFYKIIGNIKIDNLSVKEPAKVISKSSSVSGQLFSNGRFSAISKDASNLVDKLNANFQFNVKDGVLYGFDLAKAPLMLLGQGKGGETKFDEFSGVLGISDKTYQFHNLKIESGLMSASGSVKINPNKTLNGEIEVDVKNSMQIATIPLEVSGSIENPKVFPTKSAIAGAVAGTAVLGPAGTGLGIKAGKAVDKLKGFFGK
jgi:uncharacterized protein involved in outer membrane biogenesis